MFMKYKVVIAKRAEELINSAINYIINNLKNAQAAENMLLEIEHILDNLASNPMMYSYSEDPYLIERGYRRATIAQYNYVLIYRIDENTKVVYIAGFFHNLEAYPSKL